MSSGLLSLWIGTAAVANPRNGYWNNVDGVIDGVALTAAHEAA